MDDEVKPYGPLSSIRGLQNIDTYDISAPMSTIVQLLKADPSRLYAMIFIGAQPVTISPFADSQAYGIQGLTTGVDKMILIHNASYPGMVQREWYGSGAVAWTARIVDVSSGG